ncbi:hypothetical protein DFJ63DRAFT_334489 [Scheffersomyces coipomensis]|uniref:uncharacterized protein n=1 Tax=Scheffersomyces coipomensis TaxID=1788519 RepID=UPI00315D0FC2
MDSPDSSQSGNGRSKLIHVISPFYCVYVLQSIPKPRSFYIGSTPDPIRRLRQHNGELKTGGAFRTKRTGLRPWKVVLIMYNFPSNVSALQFEHSLQHPYQTRHISADNRVSHRKGSTSLHQIIANVKLLITAPFFKTTNLRILICEPEVTDKIWPSSKYNVPSTIHVDIQTCSLEEYFKANPIQDDPSFEVIKNRFLEASHTCSICNTSLEFSPEEVPLFKAKSEVEQYRQQGRLRLVTQCHHSDCDNTFHLTCMARDTETDTSSLIPSQKSCTLCHKPLDWLTTVKIATKLREYILKSK